MTIRHLRIFIEVANSGKMSLAANKFFISQPTVSQVIAELENHYNIKLFERLSKKLYITPDGEKLLEYAKKVVLNFDELESIMKSSNNHLLRIGASVTVGTYFLSSILKEFQLSQPQIKTTVLVNNTKNIIDKLLNSNLDIAIVEGEISHQDLVTTPIAKDYLVLVCGKDHKFFGRQSICVEELALEDFILREEGSGTRELFESFMKSYNIPINVSWECNNSQAIKNAVLNNFGLSVISARLIQNELKDKSIYIVPIQNCSKYNNCLLERNFCLVMHKNKYKSSSLKEFENICLNFKDEDLSYLPPIIPIYHEK